MAPQSHGLGFSFQGLGFREVDHAARAWCTSEGVACGWAEVSGGITATPGLNFGGWKAGLTVPSVVRLHAFHSAQSPAKFGHVPLRCTNQGPQWGPNKCIAPSRHKQTAALVYLEQA